MSTAIDTVNNALMEIGVFSDIKPPSPETVNHTFKYLIKMINEWLAKEITLGDNFVLPVEPADDMLNDANTDTALETSLAVRVAPSLRQAISKGLAVNACSAYTDLLISNVNRNEQPYPSSLNRGAGRNTFPFSRRYYIEAAKKAPNVVPPDPQ